MRKPLFALLMVFLTLAAVEAMAWLVRSLVYGGQGGVRTDADLEIRVQGRWRRNRGIHPFYGQAGWMKHHDILTLPARPEGALAVALLGGSVAQRVAHEFSRALFYHTVDLDTGASPLVFVNLGSGGYRQPQQLFVFANMLASGARFDVVVSLDGFNEIAHIQKQLDRGRDSPLNPHSWSSIVGMTVDERMVAGRILALRDEQEYLQERSGGIYGSATFGLLRRFRLDRIDHLIVYHHRELARAGKAHHDLEKHGPRGTRTAEEFRESAADAWHRGSLLLADLAKRHGAEYYHFLQPNQYVPGAKPLTEEERTSAFTPGGERAKLVRRGYPLLAERGRRLRERGVEFFDLSWIFADNHETLYKDDCCHLNRRGNKLLAGHMLRRILGEATPADRRTTQAKANESHLKSYRSVRERIETGDLGEPAARSVFDVYRKGRVLIYWKRPCAVADSEAPFFLHIVPVDADDLHRSRRQYGFESQDFRMDGADAVWRSAFADSFDDACMVAQNLPAYPIARIATGQYIRGGALLWRVNFSIEGG